MIFELDTDQIKKFLKWDKSHKKKCTVKNAGAIGGRLTFKFTPTSLGTITTVKCVCGEELDLSDCDNW